VRRSCDKYKRKDLSSKNSKSALSFIENFNRQANTPLVSQQNQQKEVFVGSFNLEGKQ